MHKNKSIKTGPENYFNFINKYAILKNCWTFFTFIISRGVGLRKGVPNVTVIFIIV